MFFSYSGTALELFNWARQGGGRTVLGVIDPGRVEQQIVREEAARWPGWEKQPEEPPEDYNCRRDQECQLADLIVVNSRWSLDALTQQGVPREKLRVVPLCYEPATGREDAAAPANTWAAEPQQRPFRVLFLGQVILRKGIQYLMEAARHPALSGVVFDVVGPVGISSDALHSAPPNVFFHGAVARAEAEKWYQRADALVLPTLSDGFAITQIEAMTHGLPVIATPNCGEVVRDGLDGLIVPIRDAQALAGAIQRFVQDHAYHARCRQQALARGKNFTLSHLQQHLLEVEQELAN